MNKFSKIMMVGLLCGVGFEVNPSSPLSIEGQLMSAAGEQYLPTQVEQQWLFTKGGLQWLSSTAGNAWLSGTAGSAWLSSTQTPLMNAASNGNIELVETLLNNAEQALTPKNFKTFINAVEGQGMSAVLYATISFAAAGVQVLQILLDAGAFPDSIDINGNTPLTYSLQPYSINKIQLLLSAGANPNLVNQEGYSVLGQAVQQNSGSEVISILKQYGAVFNNKDRQYQSNINSRFSRNSLRRAEHR